MVPLAGRIEVIANRKVRASVLWGGKTFVRIGSNCAPSNDHPDAPAVGGVIDMVVREDMRKAIVVGPKPEARSQRELWLHTVANENYVLRAIEFVRAIRGPEPIQTENWSGYATCTCMHEEQSFYDGRNVYYSE